MSFKKLFSTLDETLRDAPRWMLYMLTFSLTMGIVAVWFGDDSFLQLVGPPYALFMALILITDKAALAVETALDFLTPRQVEQNAESATTEGETKRPAEHSQAIRKSEPTKAPQSQP